MKVVAQIAVESSLLPGIGTAHIEELEQGWWRGVAIDRLKALQSTHPAHDITSTTKGDAEMGSCTINILTSVALDQKRRVDGAQAIARLRRMNVNAATTEKSTLHT